MENFFRFMLAVAFIVTVFNFMCMATNFLMLFTSGKRNIRNKLKIFAMRFMYSLTLLVTYYAGLKMWPIIWGN